MLLNPQVEAGQALDLILERTLGEADIAQRDRLAELSAGDYVMEQLEIAVQGLTLKIDRPITLKVVDDQITISTSVSSVRE